MALRITNDVMLADESTQEGFILSFRIFINSKYSSVRIRIPVEHLSRISLSGSGYICADYTLTSNTLKTNLSGSGTLAFMLDNNFTDNYLSGSGKIILKKTVNL